MFKDNSAKTSNQIKSADECHKIWPHYEKEDIVEESGKVKKPATGHVSPLSNNPLKILLAEDNLLNQKVISQMLQTYGFKISTADNGIECIDMLHKENKHFDVILMDLQMPLMDGYETAQLIKESDLAPDTPIIAITANISPEVKEKCLACGCVSYLAKPFNKEDLVVEIIRNLPKKSGMSASTEELSLGRQNFSSDSDNNLAEFKAEMQTKLEQLKLALAQRDYDTLCVISQDIKRQADIYGFTTMSNIAAQLLQSSESRNISLIRAKIKELSINSHKQFVTCSH